MSKSMCNSIAILLPLIAVAALAPLGYQNHLLLFNFIVFITLAQGVNVLYGFTGYLPFGYVGFFGAGAYGFAIAVMHLNADPALALAIGALISVGFGAILTPTLRLSGAYFAIANLAAALAIEQIVSNPALTDLTKGPYGVSISNVFNPTLSYAAAIGIMVLATAIVLYLRYSRFGLALQAVRDDPISAATAGINIGRARTIAWLLSALIGGLIGADFAWYVTVFFPDNVFGTNFTIFALVFALFGGVGTVIGPILGVLLLYGLYNYIGVSTPQYFQLIFGLLIVVLVLFLPNGLTSLLRRWGVRVV
ncbi:MAG: branched-chain amino acid ABC transporter permease [Burkholderiaceae bacterium]|nr:MAG: branched-chain amino acid ABC transporter permease [Burkholderiaceae bacterium]